MNSPTIASNIHTHYDIHHDILEKCEHYIDNLSPQTWHGKNVNLRLLNLSAAFIVAPINTLYQTLKLHAQVGCYLTIKPLASVSYAATNWKQIDDFNAKYLPSKDSIKETFYRIISSIMSIFSRFFAVFSSPILGKDSPNALSSEKKEIDHVDPSINEDQSINNAIAQDAAENAINDNDSFKTDSEPSTNDLLSFFLKSESDSEDDLELASEPLDEDLPAEELSLEEVSIEEPSIEEPSLDTEPVLEAIND